MDMFVASGTANQLLARVAALVPMIQLNAASADREAAFPADDMDSLRDAGCLLAPVATGLGGLGLGTEPRGAEPLARLLRLIGQANLSLGRLFEGHVNALRLVELHGTTRQRQSAAAAALDGHLFGVWVTDGPQAPLTIAGPANDRYLSGSKGFCSGAGYVTRALVTARTADGAAQMLLLPLASGTRRHPGGQAPLGMRGTATAQMDLDGIRVTGAETIGEPGAYLSEPEFSAGAWRTCAVTLGGLDALIAEAKRQLLARKRADDPHQRARMGEAFIAQETASLWVRRAAMIAEAGDADDSARQAYVNLTRIAIERACLDAMRLVQRSLGLAAFVPPNPVERLCRDLATYLRQPAPDEALSDAANWFMREPLPADDGA